jgi:hypothetical protein
MDREPSGVQAVGERLVKKHKHCWHVMSSYTNGLAVKGGDNETCCHCGVKRVREWTIKRDPKHGQFVQISEFVYEKRADD